MTCQDEIEASKRVKTRIMDAYKKQLVDMILGLANAAYDKEIVNMEDVADDVESTLEKLAFELAILKEVP